MSISGREISEQNDSAGDRRLSALNLDSTGDNMEDEDVTDDGVNRAEEFVTNDDVTAGHIVGVVGKGDEVGDNLDATNDDK